MSSLLMFPAELFQISLTDKQKQIAREPVEPGKKEILCITAPAGAGKTVVALHRAEFLANMANKYSPSKKILFLCFNAALAKVIGKQIENWELQHRVEVNSFYSHIIRKMKDWGKLDTSLSRGWNLVFPSDKYVVEIIARELEKRKDIRSRLAKLEYFNTDDLKTLAYKLASEFEWMLNNCQNLDELEEWYLNPKKSPRTGRKGALKQSAREMIFEIWKAVKKYTCQNRIMFQQYVAYYYARELKNSPEDEKYFHVIIDEAQDLTPILQEPARILIRLSDTGGSIFWDKAQNIRGISPQVFKRFEEGSRERRLTENYRNSQAVASFLQKWTEVVKEKTGLDFRIARPYKHAPKGRVKVFPSEKTSWTEIVKNALEKKKSVAVVSWVKGVREDLVKYLDNNRIPAEEREREKVADFDRTKVLVTGPDHIKGLEVDYMVIPDVERTFWGLKNLVRITGKENWSWEDLESKQLSAFFVTASRTRDTLVLSAKDQDVIDFLQSLAPDMPKEDLSVADVPF